MAKKTVHDIDVKNKKVLVRVDFNCPLADDGSISDDGRIREALPTVRHLLQNGAAVILMSHMGRPKGDPKSDRRLKMDRIADRLRELLETVQVSKSDEIVGEQTTKLANDLKSGDVLVLENLRFHPGEKKGDEAFAGELAKLADVYVNDAFGTCHRTDASMYAVPKMFENGNRVIGLLVQKELEILDSLMQSPKHPFVAVMGGAKVSDKIGIMESLIDRVDRILVGGAMTYTFLLAKGVNIGNSLVERDKVDLAAQLMEKAKEKLVLPVDHVVADSLSDDSNVQQVEGEIPENWLGLDIGPKTAELYRSTILSAEMTVWNGPMGKFEDERFQAGTRTIAQSMADTDGISVVGGGESAESVKLFGYADSVTHVSTGGGAFLAYLEGIEFDTLNEIDNKD